MGFDFRMPKQTPEQKQAAQELRMKGLKDEQLKENISTETAPAAKAAEKIEYDPQYILRVKDLKKYFPIKGGMLGKTVGNVKAVDGVTFNLKRGACVSIAYRCNFHCRSSIVYPFLSAYMAEIRV